MATQQSSEKKSILRNVVIVVLVLFTLMIITTLVTYYVAQSFLRDSVNPPAESPKNHITYDAGEFLTNLSDSGYIKLSLVYLIDDKAVEKELELKESETRDKIFTILRSMKNDSVRDSEGMEELRVLIKESLNDIIDSGNITDVYFTSIIVN
ncbi:MAG: flagellar basal body-associated FliL family protein [Tepidanaerobacteraceae bacterium]|nr:flagellar basal body-associated FliL family protein [Thermoanaerobacterales bacterium]